MTPDMGVSWPMPGVRRARRWALASVPDGTMHGMAESAEDDRRIAALVDEFK